MISVRVLLLAAAILLAPQGVYGGSPNYDLPDCDCITPDSCLVICPAGDIPFSVFLYSDDDCRTPLVGFDCMRIDFSRAYDEMIPCPQDETWPYAFPNQPTDALGRADFTLRIKGCGSESPVYLQLCGCMDVPLPCAKSLDIDMDGWVGAEDLAYCESMIGTGNCCCDFDCDGAVDSVDVGIMMEHWSHGCGGSRCEPLLLAPPDGAVDIGPGVLLDWHGASGAWSYQVQLGTSCGSGTVITVSGTETTVSDLDPDTEHYWRVRAYCEGEWGPWTDCWTFRTDVCATYLVSPQGGAGCVPTDASLNWTDVPGAAAYQVHLGASCDSGTAFTVSGSETTFSGLEPDTEYYWRARAHCWDSWGRWTDCRTFTTAALPPAAPALISPVDGKTGLPKTSLLVWQCVQGAESYEVEVGSGCGVGTRYSTTSCSTAVAGLDLDTKYCWRVRAKDVCGVLGDWSDCWCFHTASPPNKNGKWALHYAGSHNSKTNTCGFEVADCMDIAVGAPSGTGRYDVYVIAVDVDKISGTRYGLTCDGPLYFYGWTKCSDLEIPTTGWPGHDEADAQAWSAEQAGPHVTVGILDVYVYGNSRSLGVGADSRVGFAEWCDGSQPSPICHRTTNPDAFGSIGFGVSGYNPCSMVPVRLAGFGGKATAEGVLLEWVCADGADFSHFVIHRSAPARDGQYLRLHDDPIEGTGSGGRDYSYLDADVVVGTLYYYKLEGVEHGGASTFFGPYAVSADERKTQYRLSQNVPNPFRRGSTTTISYSVAEGGSVKINILDAAGRLVLTITDRARPGVNSATWDGTDASGRRMASGVYFYEVQAGGFRAEKKMLLVD